MGRLTSQGSGNSMRRRLFPRGFDGEVMSLILRTWRHFTSHADVRHENNITAVFRIALIAAYEAAGRTWFVTLEDPVVDPDSGDEEGRNDLRFYPLKHHRQTVFFSVECKRLHVTTDSGFRHHADLYVKKGLQRFVDGAYSAGMPCGGMVGYVMDGRVASALAAVRNHVHADKQKLSIRRNGQWHEPSKLLPDYPDSADTIHQRDDGKFTVCHLMLAVL